MRTATLAENCSKCGHDFTTKESQYPMLDDRVLCRDCVVTNV